MTEHDLSIEFLPDRLNADPVVFRGMTNREVLFLAGSGLAIWMPISFLIAWLVGFPVFGLAGGLVLMIAQIWFASLYLMRAKRGKPEGYHLEAILIALQKFGVANCGATLYSGPWDIVRSTLASKSKSTSKPKK